jgi:TonB family protein
MPPIRNIRFSFPCKEAINDMDSCGQKKQCRACNRTIIDFRDKSQEELDNLKKTDQPICGIFSEKQVAKGYENYIQLAAATVLAIGLNSQSANVHAQEADPFVYSLSKKDSVQRRAIAGIIITDDPPTAEYLGGITAMRSFFKEHLVYPADSVEGKVYVLLLIDTAGHVTDVRIKKSLSPLADAEVTRVAKLMVFKPALADGKPVHSKLSLPVNFILERKD